MAKVTKIFAEKDEENSKLKVAAYCRVSTDSDEQLESLEAQKKHYQTYIKSNPAWQYAGLYYDEGISGTKMEKRKQLLAMLDACERKEIDLVITKSISRFSRNTVDCLEMVRFLIEHGVFVYFEKENLNTMTMESELILSILSSMAEEESHSISKNNKWSIQKRFEQGTYVISCPPYGYINDGGEMRIVLKEAEVVRRIFNDTINGKGSSQIASELTAEGIKSKKGKKWHSTTIRGMLRNEKYTGDAIFQKTFTDDRFTRHTNNGEEQQYYCRNHHEPIISHEIFELAEQETQRRANEKNIKKSTQKYNKRYAFSGIMKCGECGGIMKRRTHYTGRKEYIAWSCGTHIEDKSKCTLLYVRDDAIKAAFTTMMNKLVFGYKEVLTPLLEGLDENTNYMNTEKQKEFDKQQQAIKERETLLREHFHKNLLSQEIFSKGMADIEQELRTLAQMKEDYLHNQNRGITYLAAARDLYAYCCKSEMHSVYDEEVFKRFVNWIIIFSRDEVGFRLNCGITLRERMVVR